MRRLGQELGVEPMSLYNHVANKGDLLDGMVETVVADLNAEVGPGGGEAAERDWVVALRGRILTAREADAPAPLGCPPCSSRGPRRARP